MWATTDGDLVRAALTRLAGDASTDGDASADSDASGATTAEPDA
jgi:hypothetical protein